VSPATTSLSAGQSTQFAANVTGGSGNTAVTWSLNPNLGTISSSGLYTAPAAINSQQTVTVTATLGTLTASSIVTLDAPVATLRTMFQLVGAPSELAGTSNGSTITPAM